ncbi:FtsW/RodA/SpoVE family cell cycle protein [Bacillus cereus]|nr:FtsW/RodA/SpoVE family cell cycle protein [Bacillus cereus]
MKKVWKSMDYSLLLPLVILCVLGVIMVYSASSILAITKFAKLNLPSDYFFRKQLQALIFGAVALSVVMFVPFQVWRKRIVTVAICGGSLILLTLVLVIGTTANNAQAWVFGIQPVEFVKVGIIIVLARYFAKKQDTDTSVWRGSAKIIFFLLLTIGLIYKQPDLGSALLIVGTTGIMFLCSGIHVNMWLKRIALTSIVWAPALYFVGKFGLTDVQKARFSTFIDPFSDPQKDGFQLINSFIGIASGGLNGRGLGNSIQKYGYLPEPHTDFIMTIISEELGFIGVAIILICLLLIIIRSFRIAQKCKNPFGSLLAIGIASMIGVQTLVNLGGITGLLPLTGVPLPFISSGGSSLMANLVAMGILLNIGSYVKRQEKQQEQVIRKKQQSEPHLVVVK